MVDLGTITLQQSSLSLDGVTVVASRPLFQQDANGMTINVESTLLGSTSSVPELLSKTPNVSLDDGEVNVLGRGTALIYLNNQQISKEQMNALSVAQIKEIKLIMNPSARFESEGRAVIQIITKQNELEGVKGSVKHISTLGSYYFANNHIGLDVRKGKWSFNAGYELQAGRELEKESFDFEIDDVNIRSSYDSKYINKTFPGHIYTFGTNYYFTPASYLSLQFNGNDVAREPVIYASTLVEQGQGKQLIQTENEEDLSTSLNAVNLNFNKDFLQAKSNLFVGTQYSSYAYRQQNEIKDSIEPTDALRLSRVNGLSNIDIFAVQADFEKSIGASTKIEIGAKNSLTKTNGDITTRAGAGTQSKLEVVPSLTNSFDYTETILAFYTQLSGQVKGITYGAGLRGEATDADGYSRRLEQQIIDSTYLNFFPNLSVSFPLDSTKTLSFNYNASINRPNYQDLDPFVAYVSYFTSYQGNPLLIPSLVQDINASLALNQLNLGVGYSRTENAISYSSFYDEELSIVKFINTNLDLLETYYTSLSFPLASGKWSSENAAFFRYNIRKDDSAVIGELIPWVYLYSYHAYNFPKGYKINLLARYRSKSNDGIYKHNSVYTIDLGASKSFFDKKLHVNLLFNDIFNSLIARNDFELNNIQSKGIFKPQSQYLRLILQYNFGKLKSANYKNRRISEEELNRLKN